MTLKYKVTKIYGWVEVKFHTFPTTETVEGEWPASHHVKFILRVKNLSPIGNGPQGQTVTNRKPLVSQSTDKSQNFSL